MFPKIAEKLGLTEKQIDELIGDLELIVDVLNVVQQIREVEPKDTEKIRELIQKLNTILGRVEENIGRWVGDKDDFVVGEIEANIARIRANIKNHDKLFLASVTLIFIAMGVFFRHGKNDDEEPKSFANTKEFQFADRTWFEDIEGYRALKADIAKNGLKNKIIEYVEIGGQRYVVRGNGRLQIAEDLGLADQLQF
jgi:hypothetical protein